MTSKNVIDLVASKVGMPKVESEQTFRIFVNRIAKQLNLGEALLIPGIGTFQLKEQLVKTGDENLSGISETGKSLLFIPPGSEEQKNYYQTFEVKDETSTSTEEIDDVFSLGVGRPLTVFEADESGGGLQPNIQLLNDVESKVDELIGSSERRSSFDIWTSEIPSGEIDGINMEDKPAENDIIEDVPVPEIESTAETGMEDKAGEVIKTVEVNQIDDDIKLPDFTDIENDTTEDKALPADEPAEENEDEQIEIISEDEENFGFLAPGSTSDEEEDTEFVTGVDEEVDETGLSGKVEDEILFDTEQEEIEEDNLEIDFEKDDDEISSEIQAADQLGETEGNAVISESILPDEEEDSLMDENDLYDNEFDTDVEESHLDETVSDTDYAGSEGTVDLHEAPFAEGTERNLDAYFAGESGDSDEQNEEEGTLMSEDELYDNEYETEIEGTDIEDTLTPSDYSPGIEDKPVIGSAEKDEEITGTEETENVSDDLDEWEKKYETVDENELENDIYDDETGSDENESETEFLDESERIEESEEPAVDETIEEEMQSEYAEGKIEQSEYNTEISEEGNEKYTESAGTSEEKTEKEADDENLSEFDTDSTGKKPILGKGIWIGAIIFVIVVIVGAYLYLFVFNAPETTDKTKTINNKSEQVETPKTDINKSAGEVPGGKRKIEQIGKDNKRKVESIPPTTRKSTTVMSLSDPDLLYREVKKDRRVSNNVFKNGSKFSVQISSWKTQNIAEGEALRLKKQGFDAFIVKTFVKKFDAYFYRVRVGYFNSKKEADDFLAKNNF